MTYSLTIAEIEKIISQIPNDLEFKDMLQNLSNIKNGMFLTNEDTIYLKSRE